MKTQDLIVAIQLLISSGKKGSFAELGTSLKLSTSETHAAVQRLKESFLLDPFTGKIRKKALEDFFIHAIQYVFPATQGKPARGMLTGFSASFLKDEFAQIDTKDTFVWPYSSGKNRGISIEPLYRTIPEICMDNQLLYHWLAVLDMLRMNRAREREVALKHLKYLFSKSENVC